MITVQQAEQIILNQVRDYGIEQLPFEQSPGRILAEDIFADRDMPPFNRVTMDGIAISYEAFAAGVRTFPIIATQAAGDAPAAITKPAQCIEIMTGAVLPDLVDTIIRYEDIVVTGNEAEIITDKIKKGQNIHLKGSDKRSGNIVTGQGQPITAAIINIMASVGKTQVQVKKVPRVVVISSGDELVEVDEVPNDFQVRRSNAYTIKTVLQQHGLRADLLHIPDNAAITTRNIGDCLEKYDFILLSGGISMGKFDYVPAALEQAGVSKLFHKVQQRPGKPFWFGVNNNGILVFAFPGNPVATFMCLHRYFLLWLNAVTGQQVSPVYAALGRDFTFEPALQYFLQVKTYFTGAQLMAAPLAGNGSGDFANLANTDAFMELPADRNYFKAGEVYRVWPF